jgi:hypothetical protein
MKIHVFSDGVRHGCFVYREEIPLEALERRGHTVSGGLKYREESGNLMDCDLFILPRFLHGDYPLVADEIKRCGKPLVYEIDDAADLFERFHTSYFQVRNMLPSYYYMLQEADLVTTTTETLAAHLRCLGARNVVVLPNCPLTQSWPEVPVRRRPGPIRIGYTGWTAHILEAAFFCEIMAALRQIRQDFIPILYGIATTSDTGVEWIKKARDAVNANPIPNREFGESLVDFVGSFQKVRPYLQWKSMTTVDEYFDTLRGLDLDIGCAVLHDTPFNRCKSCIKFYDYAGAGCVTLASEVLPYTTEPCITVPNTLDAWVRMLSLLMDSEVHRRTRLEEQRQWIRVNRNPDFWAVVREEAYQALLPQSRHALV